MNALFCLVLALIVSIHPCSADADERVAAYSNRGPSATLPDSEALNLPPWAVHVPEHSFVGISTPCSSIEAARQQALDSAIGQILQAMGAEYHLSHESMLNGDLNQSRHELKERLSYTARWLLNSVQQNIKHYAYRNTMNRHVCFVLIRMSPPELDALKRLTIGAKLTARMIGRNSGQAMIEVGETNGVGATLTEYRVETEKTHNHARLITLFFWKVHESEHTTSDGALAHRLFVKHSLSRAVIPIAIDGDRLKSLLMGSKQDLSIILTGYDEIGRPVSVPVRLQ